jgi:hypothetical protein
MGICRKMFLASLLDHRRTNLVFRAEINISGRRICTAIARLCSFSHYLWDKNMSSQVVHLRDRDSHTHSTCVLDILRRHERLPSHSIAFDPDLRRIMCVLPF